MPTIREAVEGETDLRSNRKLYKKIHKYSKTKELVLLEMTVMTTKQCLSVSTK